MADANDKQQSATSWLAGPWSRLAGWVAFLTFALDQSHKLWMIQVYRIGEKGRVRVTPFLDLIYVINEGVSYGLLAWLKPWHLATFAACTSLALWVWLARAGTGRLMAVSLGLIIGGALGNGLDRLTIGGVADFFSLHAWGFYWYVFNIADVAIVAGVIGLLYESYVESRRVDPTSQAQP
ncbi:MAG: signal peptidase II [Hyphomicrobiaceae bacterium]